MHIPDGFFDAPTSAAAGAVAAGTVALAARRTREVLGERQVPLAALTAAFVFAGQMLNFPVANGTSGHLLGGVLAAVLAGPWVAVLCLTVVLVVQALVFADGGLTALGLNIVNIALVGGLGGYAVFAAIRRLLPARAGSVTLASALAAGLSVPLAAAALVAEYAVGGSDAISLGSFATAMVGTHVLIGVGEAVITGLTVSAVLASRPDLVEGAPSSLRRPTRAVPAGATT